VLESLLTLPTTLYYPRIHLFRMHQLQEKSKQRLYSFGESLKVGVYYFIAGLVYGLFNIVLILFTLLMKWLPLLKRVC
jgi:hypothetical protein